MICIESQEKWEITKYLTVYYNLYLQSEEGVKDIFLC